MMPETHEFRYGEAERLQVLELPYAGPLSMVILLPKQVEGLRGLEKGLTAEGVQKWTSGLRKRKVQVDLPRFTLTEPFRLAGVLGSMGMPLAFNEQADFSGMSTAEGLMLSEVVHKAFVDVNEEGTEAAAATAVVVAPTAAPVEKREEPLVFRADHPFVFLVRDSRTGAVLFLGRMNDPKK
jgi:serpin B